MSDQQNGVDDQFQRQQATPQTINEVEMLLRNSRDSFEQVRKQSPTRFRFRVINRNGQDIRDTHEQHGIPTKSRTDTETGTGNHSTCVDHSFYDQCSTVFQDPTHTNWPGVAEPEGCYGASATYA